ncbi:VOC family protein [Litorivivens sp.]|uniref:VOC family protein n=1 Tax=Litorivivens sp. TaxID=2020868 RepID=UPI00356A4286
MKIWVTSVFVEDQEKALEFYTQKLGFIKKSDVPVGEHRWLTVVSPQAPDGVELVLEPNDHSAAPVLQHALKQDGYPFTSFEVDDVEGEYQRLQKLGVEFTQAPIASGNVKFAVLDDTCGNLIQIMQRID